MEVLRGSGRLEGESAEIKITAWPTNDRRILSYSLTWPTHVGSVGEIVRRRNHCSIRANAVDLLNMCIRIAC